jgi:hypothetical protein
MIALTQARMDPRARAYMARRLGEGRRRRDANRGLKRHLSDVSTDNFAATLARPLQTQIHAEREGRIDTGAHLRRQLCTLEQPAEGIMARHGRLRAWLVSEGVGSGSGGRSLKRSVRAIPVEGGMEQRPRSHRVNHLRRSGTARVGDLDFISVETEARTRRLAAAPA